MIVTPSWLKAGFISAIISSIGIIYIKLFLTCFLPFSITEYANPLASEINRHAGCIKKQENPITNTKYVKFTIGWYVLNSLILVFNSFWWQNIKVFKIVFSCRRQKNCGNFSFWKITTAEFSCDESQFSWVSTENIISMQMSTCEITSKQVLWLAPYRLKCPHFYILPSQFPNDYLSITDIKTFDAHTDSLTAGDSHPIPFAPTTPGR